MGPFEDREQAASGPGRSAVESAPSALVSIPVDDVILNGELVVPSRASGIVLFAHGGGSGVHHPRNRFVARVLQDAGFATMLIDLLTEDEEENVGSRLRLRFASLLASRLVSATRWAAQQPSTHDLAVGYFGASVGAAAALIAAARAADEVKAVVSRAGRTDLTGCALPDVRAATLLIAGSNDPGVLDLNREALTELCCEKRLEVVRAASHVFETPEAVEHVAELARGWFEDHVAWAGGGGRGVRRAMPARAYGAT